MCFFCHFYSLWVLIFQYFLMISLSFNQENIAFTVGWILIVLFLEVTIWKIYALSENFVIQIMSLIVQLKKYSVINTLKMYFSNEAFLEDFLLLTLSYVFIEDKAEIIVTSYVISHCFEDKSPVESHTYMLLFTWHTYILF